MREKGTLIADLGGLNVRRLQTVWWPRRSFEIAPWKVIWISTPQSFSRHSAKIVHAHWQFESGIASSSGKRSTWISNLLGGGELRDCSMAIQPWNHFFLLLWDPSQSPILLDGMLRDCTLAIWASICYYRTLHITFHVFSGKFIHVQGVWLLVIHAIGTYGWFHTHTHAQCTHTHAHTHTHTHTHMHQSL